MLFSVVGQRKNTNFQLNSLLPFSWASLNPAICCLCSAFSRCLSLCSYSPWMKFLCVSPEFQAFTSTSLLPFIDSYHTEDQQHTDVRFWLSVCVYTVHVCVLWPFGMCCVYSIGICMCSLYFHLFTYACWCFSPVFVQFYVCINILYLFLYVCKVCGCVKNKTKVYPNTHTPNLSYRTSL